MKLENKGDLSFFAKQDDLVRVFIHFKFLFDLCLEFIQRSCCAGEIKLQLNHSLELSIFMTISILMISLLSVFFIDSDSLIIE